MSKPQSDTVQNYNFTIHTVWQIVKDSFQSVYNCKIVSHKGGREYKSRVIWAKESQQFVNPYGLYGSNAAFSSYTIGKFVPH